MVTEQEQEFWMIMLFLFDIIHNSGVLKTAWLVIINSLFAINLNLEIYIIIYLRLGAWKHYNTTLNHGLVLSNTFLIKPFIYKPNRVS